MLKVQLPLLVALTLIVPACGGNQTVNTPLLQETFSGTFPGTTWSAVSPSGSAPTVGIVGGMLEFATGGAAGAATTTTQATFGIPSVSFSVQLAATWSTGQIGTGTIEIIDGTSTVIASMVWDPQSASVTYAILGTSVAGTTVPPSNGALNHFVFSIDSAGKGSWSLNNVAAANNGTAITATPLRIRLGATFGAGSTGPVFDFDNIVVTSP